LLASKKLLDVSIELLDISIELLDISIELLDILHFYPFIGGKVEQ